MAALLHAGASTEYPVWASVPIPDPFAAALREARRRGHGQVVAMMEVYSTTSEFEFTHRYGCSRQTFSKYKGWKQRQLRRQAVRRVDE